MMLFCIKSILRGVELNFSKLLGKNHVIQMQMPILNFINYLGFIQKPYCILFNLLECF